MRKQLKQKREKLELQTDKIYELTIESQSIKETFRDGVLYKYIVVSHNGSFYTLFLDDGLDEVIIHYLSKGKIVCLKKSIYADHIQWQVGEFNTFDLDITKRNGLPPRLEIKDGSSVIIKPLSITPIKGTSNYGSYVIFRVEHEGTVKSLFVDSSFEAELLKLDNPLQELKVERIVSSDGAKRWQITPFNPETKVNE